MSQELFDYMLKQHDIILLDTDMHEIKLICNKELIEENRKLQLHIGHVIEHYNNGVGLSKRYVQKLRNVIK